jgi:hypothetical protein
MSGLGRITGLFIKKIGEEVEFKKQRPRQGTRWGRRK